MNDGTNILNHKKYNAKNNFKVDLKFLFEETELKLLEKHGFWYKALHDGTITPITADQIYFTKTNLSDKPPINQHQEIWKKHINAQNSWGELNNILKSSPTSDLKIMSEIIDSDYHTSDDVIKTIYNKSRNLVDTYIDYQKYSYRDILVKVAHELKIDYRTKETNSTGLNSIFAFGLLSNSIDIYHRYNSNKKITYSEYTNKVLEHKITLRVFKETYDKLSKEQKKEFNQQVVKLAKESGNSAIKAGSVIATLTAANLSGFGVYLLATTTLSTITGLIGVTLPFAAYTGLSSIISLAIGPLGWTAGGLYAIYKLTDVNYKRIIPAIIYIHWLREKNNIK